MSGVVIVSHGPHLVDNTLWVHVLQQRPDALLAVPVSAAGLDWDLPASVMERVVPLRSMRLGSDTASWHSGLFRLLGGARPAVVHVDDEPWSLTVQVLVGRGYPTVVHCAENLILDAPLAYRVRRAGLRRTLRGLAGLATWGGTTQRALQAAGLPAATPTAILPARPPAPEVFAPVRPRPFAEPLLVGYAGRLAAEKGVDVAIRAAAAATRPVELHVMGEGPQLDELQRLADACGVAARFHAPAGPRRVAEFLARMDVTVAPSRRGRIWTEQWCRSAVESMMVGRPVLASDSGELPETVGVPEWIFPEDDHGALATLLDGMHDRAVLDDAAERALESAARFRLDLLAKELDGLWARTRPGGRA